MRSASSIRPKPEDVTIFTRDLALRCCAPAPASMTLWNCWRPIATSTVAPGGGRREIACDRRASFAEALARHEGLFPAIYHRCSALARPRDRSIRCWKFWPASARCREALEAPARHDAARYPLPCFVLGAAGCVLLFFLTFVLPQFGSVCCGFSAPKSIRSWSGSSAPRRPSCAPTPGARC